MKKKLNLFLFFALFFYGINQAQAISSPDTENTAADTPPPPQPRYDLSLSFGTWIPTQDKSYFKKYYSLHSPVYFAADISRFFWAGNMGYSLGLLGRYTTNKEKASTKTDLNADLIYTRTFYTISAEFLGQMHYRNPKHPLFQPGLYIAAGVNRFRESASTDGSSNEDVLGVTQFSPVYELGGTLDFSLSTIAKQSEMDLGDSLSDVLFRITAAYNQNPTKALSMSGFYVGVGFAFLME